VVVAIVCAAAYITTAGQSALPPVMRGDHYTPLLPVVVGSVWLISFAALISLWWRRPHSLLDIWLLVVLWAWMLDIALSAMLNAGRFDLGFYAGPIYGLLAASLVLLVLLIEIGALYGRLTYAFAAEREVRNRQLHEMQLELIHASRMTEPGQMASALAHEVNQPLTAVGNYVRAGRRMIQVGDTAKVDEALQKAAEQIDRAHGVIQRLRQLVKKEPGERRPEDIDQVIEEAAAFALIGRNGRETQLATEFDRTAPQVLIDKVQIQQVLLNLIRNALEAMQGSRRRDLVIRTDAKDRMVEVSVLDAGPGLSSEVRHRLFQPFVTTKAAGMGVGLSICNSIVIAHGGRMWADDNLSGGTAFHFTVPAADLRS
jgi:signal transduction histidine kinase